MNEWASPGDGERRESWWARRRRRKQCFHHEHGGNPANTRPAVSWIKQELIDTGKRKRFWCDRSMGGCGQMWFS